MKKYKFTDMKSMLRILAFFCSVLLSSLVNKSYSQVFITPNNSFGTNEHRRAPDSVQYVPTFPIAPTDTMNLHSQGFDGKGEKKKMAAIYYDSAHHNAYFWDPSLKAWLLIGNGIIDSIIITYVGVGSPMVPLLYTTPDGHERSARLVPGLYTIPFRNADSGVGLHIDTNLIVTWLKLVAQYGPPVGGNIYTVNGRVQGSSGRYINLAGNSLLFDSVTNPTIALRDFGSNASRYTLVDSGRDTYIQIGQATSSGGGIKQGMQIDVGGVRSGGLSGFAIPYISMVLDSGNVGFYDQFGNYMAFASATYGTPGISFQPAGGHFAVYSLPTTNDSSNFKSLVYNKTTLEFALMDHFGGGGSTNLNIGSGYRLAVPGTNNIKTLACTGCTLDSATTGQIGITVTNAATIQTITSGSSGTVTASNYWVLFDPSSTLASYNLTLPASPTIGQSVEIYFGKTLTSGIVITAFTVSPNTSQTILDNTPPAGSSVTTDNAFVYKCIATNTWKRQKL